MRAGVMVPTYGAEVELPALRQIAMSQAHHLRRRNHVFHTINQHNDVKGSYVQRLILRGFQVSEPLIELRVQLAGKASGERNLIAIDIDPDGTFGSGGRQVGRPAPGSAADFQDSLSDDIPVRITSKQRLTGFELPTKI